VGDARFLIAVIAFKENKMIEAIRWWSAIVPDPNDSYVSTYAQILQEQRARSAEAKRIRRMLELRESNSRVFWSDRLHRLLRHGRQPIGRSVTAQQPLLTFIAAPQGVENHE
jgi:hypothetical protein